MGTDIHGVVQQRFKPSRFDPFGKEHDITPAQIEFSKKWHTVCEVEDSRNYRLFAALADVRNGYGFAGVPTHVPIRPIAEPRGLPDDFDAKEAVRFLPQYMGEDAYDPVWITGDHSQTWLSLEEIVNWDGWDQDLNATGVITRKQYGEWDHNSPPPGGWSGSISGGDIVLAEDGVVPPENWTHCRVYWSWPLRDSCSIFIKWLEYVRELTRDHDGTGYNEARLVIGFDS